MTTEDENRPRGRRRNRMGLGGMSEASSTEGDNDISQSPPLNRRVRSMALRPVEEAEEEEVVPRVDPDNPRFTPQNRMSEVRKRASGYEREYRLKLLHRMLMRNVPLDEIAKELDVSVATVIRDRNELFKRLREEAKRLDINILVGDSVGFYTEVQSMAMRMASNSKLPVSSRLAAMRTGLTAKNDMHRFLNAAGIYDVLRYRATEESAGSEIDKLMEFTEKLLNDSEVEESVTLDTKDEYQDVKII